MKVWVRHSCWPGNESMCYSVKIVNEVLTWIDYHDELEDGCDTPIEVGRAGALLYKPLNDEEIEAITGLRMPMAMDRLMEMIFEHEQVGA